MFALARRNGIRLPYPSVEALRQAYRFRNLQDFLDLYYQGMSVLIAEQDFYDLAWAYLERAHADNVRYVEMFFDPQGHTSRGVAFATVVAGLHRAAIDAARKLGVHASLIMCFLRHLEEADAERTLDCALAFKDRSLASVSIRPKPGTRRASSSACSPAPATQGFFLWRMPARRGRRATSGKRSTCSASGASITASARWRTRRWCAGSRTSSVALTVCPLSNLRLRVVDDLRASSVAADDGRRPQGDGQFRRSGLFRRLREPELPRRVGGAGARARGDRRDRAQRLSSLADDARRKRTRRSRRSRRSWPRPGDPRPLARPKTAKFLGGTCRLREPSFVLWGTREVSQALSDPTAHRRGRGREARENRSIASRSKGEKGWNRTRSSPVRNGSRRARRI